MDARARPTIGFLCSFVRMRSRISRSILGLPLRPRHFQRQRDPDPAPMPPQNDHPPINLLNQPLKGVSQRHSRCTAHPRSTPLRLSVAGRSTTPGQTEQASARSRNVIQSPKQRATLHLPQSRPRKTLRQSFAARRRTSSRAYILEAVFELMTEKTSSRSFAERPALALKLAAFTPME